MINEAYEKLIEPKNIRSHFKSIEEFELFLTDPKNTEEYQAFKDKLKNKAKIDAL